MAELKQAQAQALQRIVKVMTPLSDEERSRLFRSVAVFFGLNATSLMPTAKHQDPSTTVGSNGRDPVFSGHKELTPKEFLADKSPQTEVERIICLAYYLTHYRDLVYFKKSDISIINTEAAQKKLASIAATGNSATKAGYLSLAPEGQWQLSTVGEQYVDALPDRKAVKAIVSRHQRQCSSKRKAATREQQGR